MKPLSLDLRERIVETYKEGQHSIREVAQLFKVNKSTVQSLLNRDRQTGSLEPEPARGGSASRLQGREQEFDEMVGKHPDLTLREYCEVWEEITGDRVGETTLWRYLEDRGFSRKKKHFGVLRLQGKRFRKSE